MNPILFVRHAETDLAGKFCGHSDPTLNAAGRQQVTEILHSLSAWPTIEVVYTSDLSRARQTAETIADHYDALLEVRYQLREISFGLWEGLTWDEILLRYPEEARQWMEQYPAGTAPQGEPFHDFESRVLHEMKFLREQADAAQIAVVTHAGFLRVALTRMCGLSTQEAWERTNRYGVIIPVKAESSDDFSQFQNLRLKEETHEHRNQTR
jgi:broad specificity phosphatase PhoE